MAVNEFIILAGIIVVGAIFLLVARIFIFGEVKLTQESMYESEAQEIISLIQRITSEHGQYFYYYREISLSNITVKDKVFTYQKDGFKFSFPVPKEVINADLKDIYSVCIVKRKSTIELLEKCPKCNVDYFCSIDECKEDCEDCGRPNSLCVGDNFCNKYIGENCQNSPNDCSCSNGICCPSSPDSDAKGCSVNTNIQKGKECWCSSQCGSGLECNPTAPTFTAYKKACCDPGKGWNGTDCVEIKPKQVFVITLVPAFYNDMNEFNIRANFIKSYTESVLPFREVPGSLVVLIGDQNCPVSGERDFSTLIRCGNDIAKKNGYVKSDLTGGIFRICVGGDGCGGVLGYTIPGSGFFVHGYDTCTIFGCPSIEDAVTTPHEAGHNFRLCEGYCYNPPGCYYDERIMFGGYCGTNRIEQKFPYQRSGVGNAPCGPCGPYVCCLGRILDNDPINNLNGGRDIMGPGQPNSKRAFACDTYLAFKEVANNIYGFDLPKVTDEDIRKCYDHIRGDTYP
jgi:hypothetical protein